MWFILKNRGLSFKMSKLVLCIYKDVKALVRCNGNFSNKCECNKGVRQGCILTPFLFSFFINELAMETGDNCQGGLQLHPDIVSPFTAIC